VLAGAALASPGWWRVVRLRWFAGGIAAVAVVAALLVRAFAQGGRYPFDPQDAAVIAGFCLIGLLLTRGLPDQRTLRMMFGAYAVVAAGAFVLSSPLGGNVVRLVTLAATPLLLVPLAARGFRPRAVAIACLAAGLTWQALPAAEGLKRTAGTKAADESFWYPVEAFLGRHHDPNYRVEVVATTGHWEALYLARRGVALARGWYRQDDWPENAVLYGPLSTPRYRAWLRRMAVRYVLLPDDRLDWSAGREATRLAAGALGPPVARLGGWTVYELDDPTPLATPARGIRVRGMTSDAITLQVSRPGRYHLRLRYTPYWKVARASAACVMPRRPWGTTLVALRPGVVRLRFDVRFGDMVGAVLGQGEGCSTSTARPGSRLVS
jgi:hypothetical protein